MATLLTWEQYCSLHSKAKEEEFYALEQEAEFEAKMVIGCCRFDRITSATYGYDQLQECLCRIIDAKIDAKTSHAGKGLTSVSNDGYSETYANTTASAVTEDLHKNIISWLSGTGLVGAY